MAKRATIPELANWKTLTEHYVGQAVKKDHVRMAVAFAVLVEALDTIPAPVQRFTQRKLGPGPNGGVFVHTVKNRVTISKHAQYYTLINTRNGRKELMATGFVHSVG